MPSRSGIVPSLMQATNMSHSLSGSTSPLTMPYGNRRHISQAVKEQIIAISAHMKASQIAEVTGISGRTVRRTLDFSGWWKTGGVTAVKRSSNKSGRPRRLNSLDISVDGLPHFSSNTKRCSAQDFDIVHRRGIAKRQSRDD
ncbi:hypothetical protein BDN67DRAFT_437797 [Paxillus ammoniavirescens]|nr:hypothetical protein BDN67DRAFT_437797 [Paxillus ammoniavirescens]